MATIDYDEYISVSGVKIKLRDAIDLYYKLSRAKKEKSYLRKIVIARNLQLVAQALQLGLDPPKMSEFFFKPEIYWAKIIKFRHLNNQKLELVIDGESGMGKSFLAADITYHFYKMYYGDQYTEMLFKRSFITPAPLQIIDERAELEWIRVQLNDAFSDSDWQLDTLAKSKEPRVEIITVDEAVETLNAKESKSLGYLKIVKQIRKARKYAKSFIFCLPNILELGRDIRVRSMNAWIHIYTRVKNKHLMGFVLGANPKGDIEFDIDQIIKVVRDYGEEGWKKNRYYWGTIHNRFKPEIYQIYKRIFIEKAEEVRQILINEGIIDVVGKQESERESMRAVYLAYYILSRLLKEDELVAPFGKLVFRKDEDYKITNPSKIRILTLRLSLKLYPSRWILDNFDKIWHHLRNAIYKEGKRIVIDDELAKEFYYSVFKENPEDAIEEIIKAKAK